MYYVCKVNHQRHETSLIAGGSGCSHGTSPHEFLSWVALAGWRAVLQQQLYLGGGGTLYRVYRRAPGTFPTTKPPPGSRTALLESCRNPWNLASSFKLQGWFQIRSRSLDFFFFSTEKVLCGK